MAKGKEHHSFDKILKENMGQIFLPLAEKQLGIQILKSEELKDKLQTTLEREGDFLRKITTKTNETFILHLEFQVKDELEMVYRMQEYHAILQKKYKLPVKQFVYYLGEKKSQMRTQLMQEEMYTGFTLRSLHSVNYLELLESEIPEEIMLAMLADFGKEKAETIIQKILHRFMQLKTASILLEKYLRQMLILARLRTNLDETLEKQLTTMAFTIDIEKDRLYLKGIEKGEYQKAIKTAEKCLSEGITIEMTAKITDLSLEEVKKIGEQL